MLVGNQNEDISPALGLHLIGLSTDGGGVFASSVQSSFLPPKRATVDRNQSRTDPDIEGTEPNHLRPAFAVYGAGSDRSRPVFLRIIYYTNINHVYLDYYCSEK
ncbi:uncharacterized protein LACBIDRAFT_298329 [Laccaria bicolor S238N-H82]|uniref:Predicted protein n=1 Tax=Laccaria bicolor (strain S238N-H82 / ATCC MYA-4686) TaxID=486041 RepID=B0E3A5_LACBS|nr:uncharacterized protein LACBIDRAFT_298329 [Laccaria bicolor S238N-H82]EDQ98674.1 predicted protein [Laccaria bicolor S238N-H82]|eukprot:XP_001890673.1 predicted protein [Laccaria bicolor S238N-H82]